MSLTPREYELLKVLLAHAGRVASRARLLRAVWGQEYASEHHYLHVHVAAIRRKLAAADPDGSSAPAHRRRARGRLPGARRRGARRRRILSGS